jgi:hypothetical protein
MRVFGTKQVERTDEDLAAAARLSAVAARFKPQSSRRDDEPEALEQPQEQAD